MIDFSIEQESFSGPFGLLLELLDARKLEIKDVHLAKIADAFLDKMESTEVSTVEHADFLVIASRLIYLKSKELMPFVRQDEEDESVEGLEEQLRIYREFQEASVRLEELFLQKRMLLRRPFVRLNKEKAIVFSPTKNISLESLNQSFNSLLKRLEPFFALQRTSMERIKSVEEKLSELKDVMATRSSMQFSDIIAGAKNRGEVVVSFLALLELIRRSIVRTKQGSSKNIEIEKI